MFLSLFWSQDTAQERGKVLGSGLLTFHLESVLKEEAALPQREKAARLGKTSAPTCFYGGGVETVLTDKNLNCISENALSLPHSLPMGHFLEICGPRGGCPASTQAAPGQTPGTRPAYLCDRVGFMELMELRGGCMGSFPGGASLWRLF